MRHRRAWLTCTVCGGRYWTHEYRASASKFCSKACWSDRAPMHTCEACGASFKHRRDTANRFCSRQCAKHEMVGPSAARWKDGLSLERDRARYAAAVRLWRAAVFARDGWRCQQCGTEGSLHAHHISPWAEDEAARFDVDNGVTLCIDCHGVIHGRDFSRRRVKVCSLCGQPTKGRGESGLCRSCASTRGHARRQHRTSAPSPQA